MVSEGDRNETYELFRRAIEYRDEVAWAAAITRVRPFLIAWAARDDRTSKHGEPVDDITDQALARAWAALKPENSAKFSTLEKILIYLHTLLLSTAIDNARFAREKAARLAAAQATPEQALLIERDRDELWRLVLAVATTESERILLVERFAYDLPPRAILARHPNLFPDVAEIYRIQRNLLERLRRNPDLRWLYEEGYLSA